MWRNRMSVPIRAHPGMRAEACLAEVLIVKRATLFAVVVLLNFVAGASAAIDSHHVKDLTRAGVPHESGRVDGDTIDEAWVIEALPYAGSGNTCGFNDDYDEVCPYSGTTSADVVYAYMPAGDELITIELCNSKYDTKVYVYEDDNTPGAPFACNDDEHFSEPCLVYSSRIQLLDVFAGHTYYIVVDGHGYACGDYQLEVTSEEPCILERPDGGLIEGEPPCREEYVDEHNSGCDWPNSGWMLIEAHDGNCATQCGESCTYLSNGGSYRDTDWYAMTAVGGDVTATCTAEFPLMFIMFYVIDHDCSAYEYTLDTSGLCEPVTPSSNFAAGQELWLFVCTSVFSGVPPSAYLIDVCGIESSLTQVSQSTWRGLKDQIK